MATILIPSEKHLPGPDCMYRSLSLKGLSYFIPLESAERVLNDESVLVVDIAYRLERFDPEKDNEGKAVVRQVTNEHTLLELTEQLIRREGLDRK